MTMNPQPQLIPLGVGDLISRTFSLFFSNIVLMFKVAFVPLLAVSAISAIYSGAEMEAGVDFLTGGGAESLEQLANAPSTNPIVEILVTLGTIVASSLISGAVVIAAYDAALGRAPQIGAYYSHTLSHLLPIVVLSIVATILFIIGFILLIIPGLYVIARYSVLVPAIVVDGAGWGGMGRAQDLTKGYRWPIVGCGLLFFLLIVVLSIVLSALMWVGITIGGLVGYTLTNAVASTITTGLAGVFTALLFARLKEIKEGVGMEDVAKVFE
jgi:hypothetical protein